MYRHIYLVLILLIFLPFLPQSTHAQQGIKLTADDAFREEQFGRGSSILGDKALIGAPSHFRQGFGGGKVYEFSREGESWVLTDSLFPPDITQGHSYGISIDMDSTFAVVGMMGDFTNGLSSGSAFVYELVNGDWVSRSKLLPDDVEAGDFFGRSVSISDDHVIVGSPGDDDQGNSAGAAYIFQRQDDSWTQLTKLLPSTGAEADSFGVSVAIHGNNALVGAPLADRMQTNSGIVTAFQWQEGTWEELPTPLQLDTETADDQFGTSIDIDSVFAVIAAPGFRGQGASYIYELIEDSWVVKDTLITNDGRGGGQYAAISTDYAVILSGALNFSQGPAIFERSGEDWMHIPDQIQEFGDSFGGEITLSGNEVLIGAYFDPEFGSDTGAAYLIDLTQTAGVITTSPDTLTLLDELYTYDVAGFPSPNVRTYRLTRSNVH